MESCTGTSKRTVLYLFFCVCFVDSSFQFCCACVFFLSFCCCLSKLLAFLAIKLCSSSGFFCYLLLMFARFISALRFRSLKRFCAAFYLSSDFFLLLLCTLHHLASFAMPCSRFNFRWLLSNRYLLHAMACANCAFVRKDVPERQNPKRHTSDHRLVSRHSPGLLS